jgi:hypothetical protein
MYQLSIRLEGLRKTTKNLSKDSRVSSRNLNPGPIEYEAEATRPQRSVYLVKENINATSNKAVKLPQIAASRGPPSTSITILFSKKRY